MLACRVSMLCSNCRCIQAEQNENLSILVFRRDPEFIKTMLCYDVTELNDSVVEKQK